MNDILLSLVGEAVNPDVLSTVSCITSAVIVVLVFGFCFSIIKKIIK